MIFFQLKSWSEECGFRVRNEKMPDEVTSDMFTVRLNSLKFINLWSDSAFLTRPSLNSERLIGIHEHARPERRDFLVAILAAQTAM
jgi:hypothetical protein